MSASTTRKRAARQLAADHPVGFQKALSVVDAVLASPGWMSEGELVAKAASLLPTSPHTHGVTPMTAPNTRPTGTDQARQLTSTLLAELVDDLETVLDDGRDDGAVTGRALARVTLRVDTDRYADTRQPFLRAHIVGVEDRDGTSLLIDGHWLDEQDVDYAGQTGMALSMLCDHGLITSPGRWHVHVDRSDGAPHTLTAADGPGVPGRYPMPIDLPCCGYSSASVAETADHERTCRDAQ